MGARGAIESHPHLGDHSVAAGTRHPRRGSCRHIPFCPCPPVRGGVRRTQGVRGSGSHALKGAGLSGALDSAGRCGWGGRSRGPCGKPGLNRTVGSCLPSTRGLRVAESPRGSYRSTSCVTDAEPWRRVGTGQGCYGRACPLSAPGGTGPASFHPEGIWADSWPPKGLCVSPGDQLQQGGRGWGPRVSGNAGPPAQTPPSLHTPQAGV